MNAIATWLLDPAAIAGVALVLGAALTLDWCVQARLRPVVRHAIWSIVALRLIVPAGWFDAPVAPIASVASLESRVSATMPVDAFASLAVLCWISGVTACAMRWWWLAARLRRRWTRLDPAASTALMTRLRELADRVGLRRLPRVVADPIAPTPYVTGLFRPALVLPFDWQHWSRPTLDHALSHELVHLRRRDLVWDALWMAIAAVHWFQPLVHLARRRAHLARELCCDARTAAAIGPDYRRTLLRVTAVLAGEHPRPAPGHGWHPAIERLRALERWPSPAPWRRRLGAIVLVAVVAGFALPAWLDSAGATGTVGGVTLDRLIDPVSRQEMGAGSLHLRYALLGASQAADGRASPPAPRD